jgi:hypothetical protein
MTDDQSNKNSEESGLNRRNFLKGAGIVVACGTLASGLTLDTAATAVSKAIALPPIRATSFL